MEPADIARVRFVSERFRELQGLRLVVTNLSLIPMFWVPALIDPPTAWGPLGVVAFLTAYLVPVVGIFISRIEGDRYYARYGRVSGSSSRWTAELFSLCVLIGALVIDTAALGSGRPSAVLAAGALGSLFIAIRDWPWRKHHLLAVAGCLLGAVLTATVPAMRIDTLPDLLRISFCILFVLGAATAYLDHRVLVGILGPGSRGSAEASARARVE